MFRARFVLGAGTDEPPRIAHESCCLEFLFDEAALGGSGAPWWAMHQPALRDGLATRGCPAIRVGHPRRRSAEARPVLGEASDNLSLSRS